MKRRGFTLMELLTVMSILAILYAISAPGILSARGAATQYTAMQALRQLAPSLNMYLADHDDRYMIPFHGKMDGEIAWFGSRVGTEGNWVRENGILTPYLGGKIGKDPTHLANPWMGDGSGFGYNWGTLGSAAYVYNDGTSHLDEPAFASELGEPSSMIAFATSAYYFATWNGGNGRAYDYGYIDPPFAWKGAPTIDCRHIGQKRVNVEAKSVESDGNAILQFADGSVRTMRLGQIRNVYFARQPRG